MNIWLLLLSEILLKSAYRSFAQVSIYATCQSMDTLAFLCWQLFLLSLHTTLIVLLLPF